MARYLLLLLLPLLPACQSPVLHPAASDSAQNFNRDTVQTYDIQTGEFQQKPPYGARSDRAQ
jgi:hypothetical protein